MSKNEHLIPTAHAAKMLGVDVRTVHRMADSGLLPAALKLPGRTGAWLFERDAVQRVVETRATEAAAS